MIWLIVGAGLSLAAIGILAPRLMDWFIVRNITLAAKFSVDSNHLPHLNTVLAAMGKRMIYLNSACQIQIDGRVLTEPCKRGRAIPLSLYAAFGDNDRMVLRIIDAGYAINAQDIYGQTILMVAAWRGRSHLVSQLLKRGAKTDIRDKVSRNALEWARLRHHRNTTAMLRDHQETALSRH
jgi:ankyrin repeat protein